jgi:hypothetical protein
MRVPKSELSQLLGAPSELPPRPPLGTPEPAPTPVTPLTQSRPADVTGHGAPAPHSDLRFELARALPALWTRARRDFVDGKTAREKEKLRDLVVWLLAKKSAQVRLRPAIRLGSAANAPTGRLDMIAAVEGQPALAIEVDWAYARASLDKLLAAHHDGLRVLWVCGARIDRTAAKEMRVRANADFGPTFSWLYMFHLEHGWL